jgi:hypothetical protein
VRVAARTGAPGEARLHDDRHHHHGDDRERGDDERDPAHHRGISRAQRSV